MAYGMSKLRWTTRAIEAIAVDERTDFTDPETKGLVLRVTPTGSKTWSFIYVRKSDGKKRRVTLNEFPIMGLAEAREEAAKLRTQVNARQDPAAIVAEYKRASTVGELLDLYIERHPRPQAAWTRQCARFFEKDVKPLIGSVKLPDLARSHVRQVVESVRDRGATTTVNRTLAAFRSALSWAVSKDILETNPAINLGTDIEEKPRDRALSIDQIRAFWHGLDHSPMTLKSRLALKLVLITGQRPGEVCGARKSEVDLSARTWLIPGSRTKNRKDHLVPLSDLAVKCFQQALDDAGESEFVFPSRPRSGLGLVRTVPVQGHALSHAMRDSLKELGLADAPATPHDLRRTAATHMARIGISDRHVGRVLNHGTELRSTITARVYIHHDYLPEKRQALEAWAKELNIILDNKEPADA